ncbi:MAG: AhpC/TSA family protein [Cyclobacteriaceae bacterium]|nr:AhpC/TSA family protein [Cyclobacteriaceae bacterium]
MRALLSSLFMLSTFSIVAQHYPDKAVDISPLLIGEKVPKVILTHLSGKTDSLIAILAKQETVVIFYRGGWCPFCNVQLAELQAIESDILKLGYQIVAISPDSPENLKASLDKHKLNYQLLSDANMNVAQQFGIAFNVPENSKERLAKSSDGQNPGQLPVPSVFVFNKRGEIIFEYINPDYKKRIPGNLLLTVLKELKP